ncbi:hypothetical protein WA026_011301 [Henosepilachna vigintioctopunctata]|uniref:Uncharacterized protein n=1 Tax=Henosepilachna vigintioctopunctata TaxID=420089 RepID=A0AAW1U674_9CUCU
MYRKYGSLSNYTGSSQWPSVDYWPYYSPYRYWTYGSLYKPYYNYLRYNFSSLPLYRSYYLESWFDRYIDWCYHLWPRYTSMSRYSSDLGTISLPISRRSFWYWPTYYPRVSTELAYRML